MILFPAIDIRNGQCVRLIQGDYGKQTTFGDPVLIAKKWAELGAEYLHIVDLDGALVGKTRNFKTIEEILQVIDIPVQVGGGIRNIDRIESLLSIGVSRVILGSAALQNKKFLDEVVTKFNEKIVFPLIRKMVL